MKCIHCKQYESCYMKRYTYDKEQITYNCSSQFWVCENEGCPYSVKLDVDKSHHIDFESFVWIKV